MKTIMMTGVTGNMGWPSFKAMYKNPEIDFRLLVRPSKKNLKLFEPYKDDPRVHVIWGDILDQDKMTEAVRGSNYVFHLGGLVSPMADYYPEKTIKVNVKSTECLVNAVLAQSDKEIKCVYIGSVAEYGDRNIPIQWGRVGDPMSSSTYDAYSESKCRAEKILVDSGIKNWVILRQSGILHPGILKVLNATVFHVPVQGCLEWTTIEDSARMMANLVSEDLSGRLPEQFWNNVYNISSGKGFRMTNYEFETRIFNALGMGSPEKIFEPQWFATSNFHGMWYEDADKLEEYLHFRENLDKEEYFKRLRKGMPWYFHLAFLAPSCLVKKFVRRFAFEPGMGTQTWLDNPEMMDVFYGGIEKYRSIKTWDDIRPGAIQEDLKIALATEEARVLDHGYDESKSIYDLSEAEIVSAAAFRGGKFLGPADASSQIGKKGSIFLWECEHGHKFTASLEFVLLCGGWCQECGIDLKKSNVTKANKFASQIL